MLNRTSRLSSRRTATTLAVGVLTVAVAASACSSSKGNSGGSGGNGPLVISIPYLGSTTGAGSTLAYETINSEKLAVDQINSQNLGFTLKVTTYDSAENPAQAVANFRKILKDNPLVVMGGFTNEAAAVAPIANQSGVPYIAGLVSDLTIATKNRPNAYVATGDIVSISQAGAKQWMTAESVKKVSAIFDQSFAATKGQSDALVQGVKDGGGSIAENLGFDSGTTDFTSIVHRALAANPDGLLVATQPGESAAIVKEIRREGSKATILLAQGSFSTAFSSAAGDSATGAYVIGQYFPGLGLGQSAAYEDKFKAATGKLPTYNFDYEAWLLLADALQKANIKGKSTDDARKVIQAALDQARTTSLTGQQIRFNAQGYVDRSGILVQIQSDGSLKNETAS